MIRLWNSTEQNFKGNKWVLNEAIKSDVTEVVNGEFALDLEYPLQDQKELSKYLLRGNIITCPVMDTRDEQQFRIRKADKTGRTVTIYAQAKLIADLGSNYIKAMTITGKTRKEAIQMVLDAALERHSFIVGNLDANANRNVTVNIQEGTVLSALIGSKNSILSEYGGEFIIDNNIFDIVDSRGKNRNFKILYGKNIASIKETIDDADLATVLIPKSGDYRLPEYVIESPKVANYEKKYFKEVELNLNIWDGDGEKGENQITEEEAYTTMRETCNNMFISNKVDQPTFNYEIDLISLRKAEEYKEYNIVEKVYLGDVVTVKHKILNLDLEGNVSKTIYNVLLDKYKSVEIGFNKQDITDIIKDTAITANTASNKINQITETSTDGVTTELSKKAFKVTCSKASGTNVTIDAEGLTVNNGKILVKNSNGDIVFTVNVDGKCTAIQGFAVEDGDEECCYIDKTGVQITNENGYTSKISVVMDSESASLLFPDHARFKKNVHIEGTTELLGDCTVDGDFGANGNFWIKGQSLTSIIQDMIDASKSSDSGSGE